MTPYISTTTMFEILAKLIIPTKYRVTGILVLKVLMRRCSKLEEKKIHFNLRVSLCNVFSPQNKLKLQDCWCIWCKWVVAAIWHRQFFNVFRSIFTSFNVYYGFGHNVSETCKIIFGDTFEFLKLNCFSTICLKPEHTKWNLYKPLILLVGTQRNECWARQTWLSLRR